MSSVLDGTREISWPHPLAEQACKWTRSFWWQSFTAPIGHVLRIDPFVEQSLSDIVRLHLSHIQPRHHDIQRIDGTLQMLITRVLIPSVAVSDLSAQDVSGVSRSNVSNLSFVSNPGSEVDDGRSRFACTCGERLSPSCTIFRTSQGFFQTRLLGVSCAPPTALVARVTQTVPLW